MREQPAFEATVWQWREHLAPLIDNLEPVSPSAEVWQRIEEALPKSSPTPALRSKRRLVKTGLAFWRTWAIGATAAAAAIAVYLGVSVLQPPPDTARLFAVLDRPDATGAGWIATFDPIKKKVSVVALAPPTIAENKSHELWFISAKADPPVSLGLLRGDDDIRVPSELTLQNGILAVSLEPKGGSPTGQPTGPVIFQGALRLHPE